MWVTQVKKVLRQQQVKPHWMFALDNLLRQAVQEAITVLLPGSPFRPHRDLPLSPGLHPSASSPLCVPELKIQLQSSFEVDESIPEEFIGPDTPVAPIPDQQGELKSPHQRTPTLENPLPAGLGDPLDVVLSTKCPLSEQLRDLRQETLG